MKIYTSYFAKVKKIPLTISPISISLSSPKGYSGLEYKQLAPTYEILNAWKQEYNQEKYIEAFQKEILSRLDPHKVYQQLYALTGGRDCVLLCYEKSQDFCHRHLVAAWLNEAGYDVKEY